MKLTTAIRWFWKGSYKVHSHILGTIVNLILNVCCSLVFVYLSKHLIDIATGRAEGRMLAYALMMAACVLMQLVTSTSASRIQVAAGVLLRNDMRSRLFTHLMESRLVGRRAMHTGDIMSRMEGDVDICADMVCITFPALLTSLVRLCGSFVFLMVLEWRLALVLVVIMPLMILCGSGFAIRMRRMTREVRETDSEVQAHLQESIQRRSVVAAMGHEAQASEVLDTLQDSLKQKTMRRADYSLMWRIAVQSGFSMGYLAAFMWGIVGLSRGTVTFGLMTAFLQLVSQLQRPVVEMTRQLPSFSHAIVAGDRLSEIIRMPREVRGEPVMLHPAAGVRFNDVSFTYPDGGREVLHHFSYDFKPGSHTAIVGETGSGKSTIAKLILAMHTPTKGAVEVYNEAQTEDVTPRTRCNFVYVPQGNTLLSGTIRDNLLISRPDATDQQIRAALHTAVAEFVYDLPEGLDTECAELGSGLSEGQAQRIAIARGLLRPGSILLLDEPTSALDSDTEKVLLERLAAGLEGRTLIVITHRDIAAELCPEKLEIYR